MTVSVWRGRVILSAHCGSRTSRTRDTICRGPATKRQGGPSFASIGVSCFGDATNGGLSGQARIFSQLATDKFLQGVLTRRVSSRTSLRNHVAAGVAAFKRIAKGLRLLCRRRQLDGRSEFHAFPAQILCFNRQDGSGASTISIKVAGFRAVFFGPKRNALQPDDRHGAPRENHDGRIPALPAPG
jgi:hypothetical protein